MDIYSQINKRKAKDIIEETESINAQTKVLEEIRKRLMRNE